MNTIRKYTGVLWLALGLAAGWFSIAIIGWPKFNSGLKGSQADLVFGSIVLFILTPLIVGALLVFGYYALNRKYDID
jgi:biotin transporter BioY